MAKINKQEVIQKLVDELKLYPGKDVIPSELADKILAVYQINTQDVNVTLKGDIIKYQDTTADDQDKTFTVPEGKTWDIQMIATKYISNASVGDRKIGFVISDETAEKLIQTMSTTAQPASKTQYYFCNPEQSTAYFAASAGGLQQAQHFLPIGKFTLQAGYTINIKESNESGDAGDDMVCTIIVNEKQV